MAAADGQDRPASVSPLSGRSLATAVQFLTRLPVPTGATGARDELSGATAWFPLVGVLVGAGAAGAFAVAEAIWNPPVAAVVAVASGVALTGAFHEDGLADTFDGLWGGWTPEDRLEIMRDSRLGTYGAAALVLGLGLRITLLAGLSPGDAARALVTAHMLGRATVLPLVRLFPAARQTGQGARVAEPAGLGSWAVATITVLGVGVIAVGAWLPVLLGAAAMAAWLMATASQKRVGGITGDVLGAANQLAHIAALATVAAITAREVF